MKLTPGDGCGNRFLVGFEGELEAASVARGGTASNLAAEICAAAGVDGLLAVGDDLAALDVRIYNRDGSDGGGCLNGLRVAAVWTKREDGLLRMAGREVRWHRERRGAALELPVDADALQIDSFALDRTDSPQLGLSVAFWNPHAVFTVSDAELDAFALADFAAEVRADTARFPDGVNVSVVAQVAADRFRARVDERGVGETEACGSGAVAIAATIWRGRGPQRLEIMMRGGELDLERLPGGQTGLRGAARLGPPTDLGKLLAGGSK